MKHRNWLGWKRSQNKWRERQQPPNANDKPELNIFAKQKYFQYICALICSRFFFPLAHLTILARLLLLSTTKSHKSLVSMVVFLFGHTAFYFIFAATFNPPFFHAFVCLFSLEMLFQSSVCILLSFGVKKTRMRLVCMCVYPFTIMTILSGVKWSCDPRYTKNHTLQWNECFFFAAISRRPVFFSFFNLPLRLEKQKFMVIIVRKMLIWKRIYHSADAVCLVHARDGPMLMARRFHATSCVHTHWCGLELQFKAIPVTSVCFLASHLCVYFKTPVCMPLLFTSTELLPFVSVAMNVHCWYRHLRPIELRMLAIEHTTTVAKNGEMDKTIAMPAKWWKKKFEIEYVEIR